ncbi:hypothetical protein JTB14_003501 [Gonioctena quinquepunctata]|nr:hypothetical protein JTB14_003501 [Gonioctena quinquepunctata]
MPTRHPGETGRACYQTTPVTGARGKNDLSDRPTGKVVSHRKDRCGERFQHILNRLKIIEISAYLIRLMPRASPRTQQRTPHQYEPRSPAGISPRCDPMEHTI